MPTTVDTTTPINPQITDAVTQANVKAVGQAPALAIAEVYQAIAHASEVLVMNAVSAQQQQCMLNQSAAAQGTIFLYSQGGAQPPGDGSSAAVNESAASVASNARGDATEPANLETAVQETAHQFKQLTNAHSAVNSQILDAIDSSHHYTLGAAGAFAYAHHVSMAAFLDGLEKLSAVQYQQQMQAVRIAATSVCLEAMLKSPERAEEYAAVLEAIKQL